MSKSCRLPFSESVLPSLLRQYRKRNSELYQPQVGLLKTPTLSLSSLSPKLLFPHSEAFLETPLSNVVKERKEQRWFLFSVTKDLPVTSMTLTALRSEARVCHTITQACLSWWILSVIFVVFFIWSSNSFGFGFCFHDQRPDVECTSEM